MSLKVYILYNFKQQGVCSFLISFVKSLLAYIHFHRSDAITVHWENLLTYTWRRPSVTSLSNLVLRTSKKIRPGRSKRNVMYEINGQSIRRYFDWKDLKKRLEERVLLVLGIFWKVKQVYHHSGKSLLAIIIVCMLSHILFSGHYNDEKETTW